MMAIANLKENLVKRTSSKQRLLDATSDLLSRKDDLRISLAEISQHAGVNHGLVNYHFKNKEGLLFAVLQKDADEAIRQFDRLMSSRRAPEDKLRRHLRGIIDTYRRKPYINRLIAALQSSGYENAKRLSTAFVTPLKNLQAELLLEAEAAGIIRPTDPVLFYFTTIGACDFLFQSRNVLDVAFGISDIDFELSEDYAEFIADMVLKGLAK